jgi:integrase
VTERSRRAPKPSGDLGERADALHLVAVVDAEQRQAEPADEHDQAARHSPLMMVDNMADPFGHSPGTEHRGWTPSLAAAGVKHRRIYDLRHTYATWSLAAGSDIFTLARRMGTSVKMIDRTYGHLVAGADAYERELLDAIDQRPGRYLDALEARDAA